jgi:aminodeoxyfutalosine synthase
MLYGHLEEYSHRIDHMTRLRDAQDRTGGFQVFIPLKFRKANNPLGIIGEVSSIEDLRNYAISRIFLDNFPHIKAYWPMIGKEVAALSLSFGVDDLDGTIEDTTKIYSMAGAEEQNPAMTTEELTTMIRRSGWEAVERDTLYNTLNLH